MKSTRIEEEIIQPENPIYRMLFIGMTLKAWAGYAKKNADRMKAAADHNASYNFSDSNKNESDDDGYEEVYEMGSFKHHEVDFEKDFVVEEEDSEDEESPNKNGKRTPIRFSKNLSEKGSEKNILSNPREEPRIQILKLEPAESEVKRANQPSFLPSPNLSRSFSADEVEDGKS